MLPLISTLTVAAQHYTCCTVPHTRSLASTTHGTHSHVSPSCARCWFTSRSCVEAHNTSNFYTAQRCRRLGNDGLTTGRSTGTCSTFGAVGGIAVPGGVVFLFVHCTCSLWPPVMRTGAGTYNTHAIHHWPLLLASVQSFWHLSTWGILLGVQACRYNCHTCILL